ncbi:MAG: DUF1080 domain-containing protein [Planctomycetota bacterium]|nr:DUF1080 domain-containing protein [Planctomycetota bacterium]
MHIQVVTLLAIAGLFTSTRLVADDPNILTAEEKSAGFQALFGGKDFAGWQQKGNWAIEDGAMTRKSGGGGISYVAKKIPNDFELRFQWKVGKGSNSGVYYRPGQYEYQILDNKVHADGKNPRTSAASLYFCMAPSHDATNPVGEWNSGKVVCKGTVVQHWLNGKKVIDFDYADERWKWNVELLRQRGAELAARGANLSLQDHGDPVWYRAIKLKTLGEGDKLDRSKVEPAKIPEAILKAEAKKLEGILKRRNPKQEKK